MATDTLSRIDRLSYDRTVMRSFLNHDQWQIIDRAIERYSAGEISDLHAMGLISAGFLKLDADRQAAIAKVEGRS